jgi:hypothetical protein
MSGIALQLSSFAKVIPTSAVAAGNETLRGVVGTDVATAATRPACRTAEWRRSQSRSSFGRPLHRPPAAKRAKRHDSGAIGIRTRAGQLVLGGERLSVGV